MSPESVSAATSAVAPSDAAHPYVMQQAARQVATAHVGTTAPFQAGPKMVAVGGAGGGPQREVFGFALASSLADPSVGYPTWDFSLLTTVAYFGIHVQDDGNFVNDAGVTAILRPTSPQADAKAKDGFLEVKMHVEKPLAATLSGRPIEYAILLLTSREAGRREATIGFDVGQGTQDLGFRGEVPVLFTVRPVEAPASDRRRD